MENILGKTNIVKYIVSNRALKDSVKKSEVDIVIYVISVCVKKQYRTRFVSEKQLNVIKKKFVNNKIKDLIIIGVQMAISEFEKKC